MKLDLLEKNKEPFDGSDYIAVLSDRVDCGKYEKSRGFVSAKDGSEFDLGKLLELRVFNEEREYRAFRDNLGEAGFLQRIAEDSKIEEDKRFDELHYLDYDEVRTKEARMKANAQSNAEPNAVLTTGGGKFYLEGIAAKRKVLVRTYLKADSTTGLEYAFDWRVVGYRDEGAKLPREEE